MPTLASAVSIASAFALVAVCTQSGEIRAQGPEAIVNGVPREQGAPQAARASGSSCAALGGLAIPDVSIVSATSVAGGPLVPAAGVQPLTVPALCRIVAVATPSRPPRSHHAQVGQ